MAPPARPRPFWGALGILTLLCACESAVEAARPTDDGVSANQFDDIPVPDGLTLRERLHASDSVVVGDWRYGNFEYTGSVPVAEVAAYMRERMPQHAWELVAEEVDPQGRTILKFRRGKYEAECTLGRTEEKTSTKLIVKVRTTLDEKE